MEKRLLIGCSSSSNSCCCFHAKLELVDKFCYLGGMLSVDGDADAAVEARIRIGWNKLGSCATAYQ